MHLYDFEVKDEFFTYFEDSFLSKGDVKVDLSITKQTNLLIAEFSFSGSIQLVCDRSLEEFDYQLDNKYKVHFKYADNFEEISDEIIHIPFGLPQLDLSQYIYEFIGLSVPMRKIHPNFADDDSDGEFEEVYISDSGDSEEGKDELDPRWAALKKLKK